MAELQQSKLVFENGCPDCGRRTIDLPLPLPSVADDFDWMVRTWDDFRRVMLEELAAQHPERKQWSPVDLEIVIIEALAFIFDQLSDMNDRITAEQYLETARRPEDVLRLLTMTGYNPMEAEGINILEEDAVQKLLQLWRNEPAKMEKARRAGPVEIHTQQRMITADDYALRISEHPLVLRAFSWSQWDGSWPVVYIMVALWKNLLLDNENLCAELTQDTRDKVDEFHNQRGLPPLVWDGKPSARTILTTYVEAWRMIGQEVFLVDAKPVGIFMSLSVGINSNYFQTEMRHAVEQALGTEPEGFFEPGKLKFGDDIFAGDIYQVIMNLEGVETVCLNMLKRTGSHVDYTAQGFIPLDDFEVAICQNNPAYPQLGYFTLNIYGGRNG